MNTTNQIIANLEKQLINLANANLILGSQGYIVNTNQMQLSILLIDAYHNSILLNEQQKRNIDNVYNKLSVK